MTDRHADAEPWFDDEVIAVRTRSPAVRAMSVVAAAAMAAAVWVLIEMVTTSNSTETTVTTPSPPPGEVTLTFGRDPTGAGGSVRGTISNNGDEPFRLDCMIGTLWRRDAATWVQVGHRAVWRTDDAHLGVYPGPSPGIDCSQPPELLEPGDIARRQLSTAEWIGRSADGMPPGMGSPEFLEAGSYRFEVISDGALVAGNFVLAAG